MIIFFVCLEFLIFVLQQSVLIVVDMQNVYVSQGGYLDFVGFDVFVIWLVIDNINIVVVVVCVVGMLIIWFQNGWDDQYVEVGGLGLLNYYKFNVLKMMCQCLELQGKLLVKGGWDYQLVDELMLQEGDIVLLKLCYSGFFNILFDSILCSCGICYLVFIGIVINVCVELMLCDGFFFEYFGIVLEDVIYQVGLVFVQQVVLFNIEIFFGWISDVESFCYVLFFVVLLFLVKEKCYV